MSKKIQISTVKQTADVQVIDLNAYIIAKAVRASVVLHNAFDEGISEETVNKCDETGKPITDEIGNPITEKVRSLNVYNINPYAALNAYDTAVAFIDELVAAFEGDE